MLASYAFLVILQNANIHPDLKAIVTASESLSKLPAQEQYAKKEGFNATILKLIASNSIYQAEEFRIAADNIQPSGNGYENVRIQYELLYTAVAMGDLQAREKLGTYWDNLMMSLGRKRPIGGIKDISKIHNQEVWKTMLAPKCVTQVWVAAPTRIRQSDNLEITKMFGDDQSVRQGELTMADYEKMARDDAARLKRIKELVRTNKLDSANDFYHAAFLFQHGDSFDDYQMAHQLSVCSVLLGRKGAKWIGAASYDRMLRSIGHKQRWATQYRMVDSVWFIQPHDADGICDNQRKAVTGKTLEQAINFKGSN